MSIKTIDEIKAKFETGDIPTGPDFEDLIDTLYQLPSLLSFLFVNGETGNDSNDGLTPDSAFKTIQAAVNDVSLNQGVKIIVIAGSSLGLNAQYNISNYSEVVDLTSIVGLYNEIYFIGSPFKPVWVGGVDENLISCNFINISCITLGQAFYTLGSNDYQGSFISCTFYLSNSLGMVEDNGAGFGAPISFYKCKLMRGGTSTGLFIDFSSAAFAAYPIFIEKLKIGDPAVNCRLCFGPSIINIADSVIPKHDSSTVIDTGTGKIYATNCQLIGAFTVGQFVASAHVWSGCFNSSVGILTGNPV